MTKYQKIVTNYLTLLRQIKTTNKDCTLVVVCKNQPIEKILPLYGAGCRNFAENKVSSLIEKKGQMPADIKWHLIGTLQSNKVSKIVGQCELIHSIDSIKLLEKVNHCCLIKGIKQKVLLQVNISGETSKHGLTPLEWESFLKTYDHHLAHVEILGWMTMAPRFDQILLMGENPDNFVMKLFSEMVSFVLRVRTFLPEASVISMGMSEDWPLAIQSGATCVRIGSAIFNEI